MYIYINLLQSEQFDKLLSSFNDLLDQYSNNTINSGELESVINQLCILCDIPNPEIPLTCYSLVQFLSDISSFIEKDDNEIYEKMKNKLLEKENKIQGLEKDIETLLSSSASNQNYELIKENEKLKSSLEELSKQTIINTNELNPYLQKYSTFYYFYHNDKKMNTLRSDVRIISETCKTIPDNAFKKLSKDLSDSISNIGQKHSFAIDYIMKTEKELESMKITLSTFNKYIGNTEVVYIIYYQEISPELSEKINSLGIMVDELYDCFIA